MSMMYKIFYAILGTGILGGALFALWSQAFNEPTGSFWLYLGLTAALGLVYGFFNYIFIKAVLRIFVNKFHTLERVLVGTNPQQLPNVLLSNEIDEIEASIVRITDEFNKLSSTTTRTPGTLSSRMAVRSSTTGSASPNAQPGGGEP